MKWYHYLSVGAYIAGWIGRSVRDGVITSAECVELIKGIFDVLDIQNVKILNINNDIGGN